MVEVAATSYLALFSAALCQQLADCASFQALVGVGSAAAAKGLIVEDDGGDPAATTAACDGSIFNANTASFAIVRIGEPERVDRGALLSFGWEIPAEIDLIMRGTAGDSAPSVFRRARNSSDAIRAEFEALFGSSSTRIAYGRVKVDRLKLTDELRALHAASVSRMSIFTRDIP
jgi:hypothetical protein